MSRPTWKMASHQKAVRKRPILASAPTKHVDLPKKEEEKIAPNVYEEDVKTKLEKLTAERKALSAQFEELSAANFSLRRAVGGERVKLEILKGDVQNYVDGSIGDETNTAKLREYLADDPKYYITRNGEDI